VTKKLVENYINKYYLPNSDELVEIKEVWENRFRVNIRDNSNKIKSSFFLRVDDKNITYCNPPLNKNQEN